MLTSPSSKNFRVQKSSGKFLASNFLDQYGILPIDYLPNGQTINPDFYSSLLVQLKEKRRSRGHQAGLVLAQQCSCSQVTCNPEETVLPGLPLS
jgi:hypothetical protein